MRESDLGEAKVARLRFGGRGRTSAGRGGQNARLRTSLIRLTRLPRDSKVNPGERNPPGTECHRLVERSSGQLLPLAANFGSSGPSTGFAEAPPRRTVPTASLAIEVRIAKTAVPVASAGRRLREPCGLRPAEWSLRLRGRFSSARHRIRPLGISDSARVNPGRRSAREGGWHGKCRSGGRRAF